MNHEGTKITKKSGERKRQSVSAGCGYSGSNDGHEGTKIMTKGEWVQRPVIL